MIQGKIERWHQTLKNRILLENYYLPGDLQAQIDAFIDHYNHRRYHESLDNLTPPTSTSRTSAASTSPRSRTLMSRSRARSRRGRANAALFRRQAMTVSS